MNNLPTLKELRRAEGMTLPELIITVVILGMVLAGMTSLFIAIQRESNSTASNALSVNQSQQILDLIEVNARNTRGSIECYGNKIVFDQTIPTIGWSGEPIDSVEWTYTGTELKATSSSGATVGGPFTNVTGFATESTADKDTELTGIRVTVTTKNDRGSEQTLESTVYPRSSNVVAPEHC